MQLIKTSQKNAMETTATAIAVPNAIATEPVVREESVYLPMCEEDSVALEVCRGCSYAKCRFCDFQGCQFKVHSIQRITESLEKLSFEHPFQQRLFFLGENAFCLPTERLMQIIGLAKQHMLDVREFAMYARVNDIASKTDEELAMLAEAGVDALHVGVESGCDDVLAYMGKGFTSADAIRELHRLDAAGIGYHINVILGLGGKSYSRYHAMHTAQLLDRVNPRSVWCMNLHVFDGTPLHRECVRDQFDLMNPVEMLQEEYFMLQNIHKLDTLYMDTTVLGKYTVKCSTSRMKELRAAVRMLIRNANFL